MLKCIANALRSITVVPTCCTKMQPTASPKPKPILKKPQATGQQKKGIVWNEENLHETSLERGTRTKIDEPDTPYHYPGDYSISADSSEDEEEKAKTPQVVAAAPTLSLDELAKKLESEQKKQEAGFELAPNPERTEQERSKFLQKRKLHYAEGMAWKQTKKTNKQDKEFEEEEKEPK